MDNTTEKITGTMSLNADNKLTSWLMEPGGSMPHSQELYNKPNQPNSTY